MARLRPCVFHGISYTDTMEPRVVLEAFDRYLEQRNLRLEGVVIGGTALNLLGVVARPTKDCDILYPPLPAAASTQRALSPAS
jgi:hypothetical protein